MHIHGLTAGERYRSAAGCRAQLASQGRPDPHVHVRRWFHVYCNMLAVLMAVPCARANQADVASQGTVPGTIPNVVFDIAPRA